jgi:hypothetical protein
LRDGEEVFNTGVRSIVPDSSILVTLFEYGYFCERLFREEIPRDVSDTIYVGSENMSRLIYFAAAKPDGPAPIIAIVLTRRVVMLLAQCYLLVDIHDAKMMKPTNVDI